MTDHSHEERLSDSTVIESKARRRHIVMTSRSGEAEWRARPITNDSDDNDGNEHENDEYEARREREREREAASMIPLGGGGAREVTLRGRREPAYDATESRVVKKTRFTLGRTNLEG